MSQQKNRQTWTPKQNLRIVVESLQSDTRLSQICRREGLNHERLDSSLSYPRPVDYYRGDPEALPAERRRKLQRSRELRKQENLKLRRRLIPWTEAENVA